VQHRIQLIVHCDRFRNILPDESKILVPYQVNEVFTIAGDKVVQPYDCMFLGQ
jgi:hypothetical protein